jgi:YfiH family protein
MNSVNCNGVSYYQFKNLARLGDIGHGIFTRNSGCSKPPFASLNVSHGIGDEINAVEKNRESIANVMGADAMTYIDQVHGSEIAILGRDPSFGKNPARMQPITADAVVTDLPGNYLVIQVADCQSVLMCEPGRRVVANVHSGWRGSIANIIGRTVDVMVRQFGCKPGRIQAAIGPSLGPCCAEFVNYKTEISGEFWRYRDANNHFDFWAISADQLNAAGVPEEHIESSRICTRCRTDEFFSYRAEKITGRFAAVIGMKDNK